MKAYYLRGSDCLCSIEKEEVSGDRITQLDRFSYRREQSQHLYFLNESISACTSTLRAWKFAVSKKLSRVARDLPFDILDWRVVCQFFECCHSAIR